jgi:hypothetical protein
MLWPAHGVSGIDGEDLADHHPVEQHPQGRQPQLYGWSGV